MQKKIDKKKCRNCLYNVTKGIRRCPYCGILNPTIEIKEIIITIFAIVTFMFIYSVLIH